MIRPATIEDIPRIVELGNMLHQESRYAAISFSEEKVAALMKHLIQVDGVVFVAEVDGEIVGGIAGGVTEFWFSTEKQAFDYSFFLAPDARHGMQAVRLMVAFESWAKLRGARQVDMGITTDIHVDKSARLYTGMGYKDCGKLFVKEIDYGNRG